MQIDNVSHRGAGRLTRAFVFAVTLLATISLATGAQSRSGSDDVTLRVSMTNSPAALGLLKATETMRTAGTDVKVLFHRTQAEAVVGLVRGDVDVAILPIYAAAKTHTTGTPLLLTHAVYGDFLYILERPDAPEQVNALDDLGGKRLLMGKQTGPLYLFPKVLFEDLGILDDVATTGATAQQISQMLLVGRGAYGVLREPLATMVVQRIPGTRRAVNLQNAWEEAFGTRMVQAGIVMQRPFVEAHPQLARDLMSEIESGYRWVTDHPEPAAQLAGREVPGANVGVIRSALPVMGVFTEPVAAAQYEPGQSGGRNSSPGATDRSNGGNRSASNTGGVSVAGEVQSFLSLLLQEEPAIVGGSLPGEEFYAW